jgi:hypothetical protein
METRHTTIKCRWRLQLVMAHNLHDCMSCCLHELLFTMLSSNSDISLIRCSALTYMCTMCIVKVRLKTNRSMFERYKLYFQLLCVQHFLCTMHLNCRSYFHVRCIHAKVVCSAAVKKRIAAHYSSSVKLRETTVELQYGEGKFSSTLLKLRINLLRLRRNPRESLTSAIYYGSTFLYHVSKCVPTRSERRARLLAHQHRRSSRFSFS